jgi:ligand-binding sensor domain-containing protein/two-component sensor histidine kinase
MLMFYCKGKKTPLSHWVRIVFLCFLICAFTKQSSGIEISFTRISSGLSSEYVNCVAQSANGYIWVGTKNGIQRYDGYRFRQMNTRNSKNPLPYLPVDQLFALSDPNLIIVRMGHRIGLLDTRTFSYQESEITTELTNISAFEIRLAMLGNQVFLIIHGEQILAYNFKKNAFAKNPHILEYPPDWRPTSIQKDLTGKIWIGGEKGLGYYLPYDHKFFSSSLNEIKSLYGPLGTLKHITNFLIDSRGKFFITSWPPTSGYKAYSYVPNKKTLTALRMQPHSGSNYNELSQFFEKDGYVWGFGLNLFNLQASKNTFDIFYTAKDPDFGIQIGNVHQIFADREKNIWVTTDNGLYIMSIIGDHVRNASVDYLFKDASMLCVTPLAGNKLLAGSWGNGIASFSYNSMLEITHEKHLQTAIYKGIPSKDKLFKMVWSIVQDQKSRDIWLGCQGGRVIHYLSKQGVSKFLMPEALQGQTVRCILSDSKGDVWLGTHGGILAQKKGANFKRILALKSSISRIIQYANNSIIIGTVGQGIFGISWEGKILFNIRYRNDGKGLTTDRIADLALLNENKLAVAGSTGLDIIDLRSKKVKQYNMGNGLPNGVIASLVTDKQGMLWMGTLSGIYRFNPQTNEFKSFDKKSGLVNSSNSRNLMEHASLLEDGKVIFNGERSFIVFDPAQLNKKLPPKKLTITDFRLFDAYLSMDSINKVGKVILRHEDNFFNLTFAPLSYGDNNLNYYYKLEGAGTQWIRTDNGLSATFASLAPGKYNFMVRSQNAEGKYSPITCLPIVIEPAFYQSWWFFMILICISLGGIFFLYRIRIKRLLEVHRLREKVARDLHDDVGSTLTSINILSELARNAIDEDSTVVSDFLDRIGKNSSQMMESMDEIVWSIKPDNDQLLKIAARLREYTANVLENQDINYKFDTDDNIVHIKLDMEKRRNLFLIYKEVLNNLLKYASATQVDISILYDRNAIQLRIRDNGVGFDLNQCREGNGLYNIRARSEILGGKLEIISAPSKGTQISLTVPV